VVHVLRALEAELECKTVMLRGNHEDAWLRVIDEGWIQYVLPSGNGCLATMRSFQGRPPPGEDEAADAKEMEALFSGSFFPDDVIAWMRSLPLWYEDEHAVYVHAGVPRENGRWIHPSEVPPPARVLLWTRSDAMFREYDDKTLVIGHTITELLPPELSSYTPADPTDLWASDHIIALDTGCGKGGFLTAVELPARTVYESR
jgi:serine/threonine protein phosphatase 1